MGFVTWIPSTRYYKLFSFSSGIKGSRYFHSRTESAEEAFYDLLADWPEVLLSLGGATLKKLASELTEELRNSATVDWQFREDVRAKMRILIKQLLRKYK